MAHYSYKRAERAFVPYSFQCEQCMQQSGPLQAEITGLAAESMSIATEKDREKLQRLAHRNLVMRMHDVYDKAANKKVFAKEFRDKCPHCGKPQSWGIAVIKNDIFVGPVAFMALGLMAVMLSCFVGALHGEEQVATFFRVSLILAAAASVVSVIVSLIRIAWKKRATAGGMQKNLPQIEWGAVWNLIEEPVSQKKGR